MVKNLPNDAGDTGAAGSILGLGRSPGEGNGNAPPYSCLENPMDRKAWREQRGRTRLSMHTCMLSCTPQTASHSLACGELLLRFFPRLVPLSPTHSSLWTKNLSGPPWSQPLVGFPSGASSSRPTLPSRLPSVMSVLAFPPCLAWLHGCLPCPWY